MIPRRGSLALPAAAVALALALVGLNGQRFLNAKPEIRTKDLAFLPSPIAAELMCLGHRNTLAKMRWIDSFAYFQLQLDRGDDRIAGTTEHAFDRLYRTLIHLDPRFLDYYDHAALTIGGIHNRPASVLQFFMTGLLWQPQATSLWRQSAVILKTSLKQEECNPVMMNGFLDAWANAEATPEGKEMVWDWKAAFARRVPQGLEQSAFWIEQLRLSPPGSPRTTYITDVLREQLARFGETELAALQHATSALDLMGCLNPVAISARYGASPPMLGPIGLSDGHIILRSDPFGYPWIWHDGRPASSGLLYHRAKMSAASYSLQLADRAIAAGRWPKDLSEAVAIGLKLPTPPTGVTWGLSGRMVTVNIPPPTNPPWSFTQ